MESKTFRNCEIWNKPITVNFQRAIWNRLITANLEYVNQIILLIVIPTDSCHQNKAFWLMFHHRLHFFLIIVLFTLSDLISLTLFRNWLILCSSFEFFSPEIDILFMQNPACITTKKSFKEWEKKLNATQRIPFFNPEREGGKNED